MLAKVTRPDGSELTFAYDALGHLGTPLLMADAAHEKVWSACIMRVRRAFAGFR
jgi:hypothetical protein